MSLRGAAGRDASVSPPESPRPDQRFPGASRLKARRQFLEIYRQGRRASCPSFTFFALPNTAGHSRIGITATRKLGGAVTRTRAKRLLRELFRRNRESFRANLDVVVNVHPALLEQDFAPLQEEFRRCARRLTPRGERT